MTTLWTERLPLAEAPHPGIRTRDDRVVAFARELARDALAQRRVWCVAACERGAHAADALRARLGTPTADEESTPAATAGRLDVAAAAPLHEVAEALDAMLCGAPPATRLGSAARAALAERDEADAAIGREIVAGDVVVLHDALTATLAQAIRDRGAHAVWLVDAGHSGMPASRREAFDFLARYTGGLDAYVVAWRETLGDGRQLEHVAALMPHSDVVELKEVVVGGVRPPGLGFVSALADVVAEDRAEHVGGRLHARPAVPLH